MANGNANFTEVSARQWDFVTQQNLTAQEAVAFLLNGMRVRSFQEILFQVCGTSDLEKRLVHALCAMLPGVQPASIRRKVRNWYSGKAMPTEREDVFQVCFALNLDPARAGKLLTLLTEQDIHYRNPREMVYAYALRYHLGYGYACHLAAQFAPQKEAPYSGSQEPVSQLIHQEFQSVRAEEDLFSFILRHRAQLGTTHNTAYSYFCKMLTLLTGEDLAGEEQYSMEYVADTYLRLNVPKDKKTGNYSDIQKMVKKYWPGPRSIKAMKSRQEDVNRKTLLLMYLVTGGVWEQDYDELDEAYIQPKEFLETHCQRMNKMLHECGMGPIDPRNVFDYLVLYCLRPEDTLYMSDRMAALAAEIFNT